MNSYLLIIASVIASIVFNTSGQLLLKMGAEQMKINLEQMGLIEGVLRSGYLFCGLTAYALSTIFYILILGKINLSVIYPSVIGITIIATTLIASILFKEQVQFTQWVGTGLIVSGVIAITLGKVS